MPASVIESTRNLLGYDFFKEVYVIDCKQIFGHIMVEKDNFLKSSITKENLAKTTNLNSINFVSEQVKILVSLQSGPYHFLANTVTSILQQCDKNPNALFVLDTKNLNDKDITFANFLYNVLKDIKINFKVINSKDIDYIVINNFYHLTNPSAGLPYVEKFFDLSKKYIKNINIEPNKKVYLSRKKILDRSFGNILNELNVESPDNMTFKSDNRIFDEFILENFFKSHGFEIVVPEDFINFNQQINYFYSVKTLVSVTSSGITNSMFMQNGGNVVELVTPLSIQLWEDKFIDGSEQRNVFEYRAELHHFYSAISYVKGHNYFGIPNKTRNSNDIVNHFLKTNFLKELLK